MVIKDDDRNRNIWKLGVVEDLILRRDGVVRVVKPRAGKSTLGKSCPATIYSRTDIRQIR